MKISRKKIRGFEIFLTPNFLKKSCWRFSKPHNLNKKPKLKFRSKPISSKCSQEHILKVWGRLLKNVGGYGFLRSIFRASNWKRVRNVIKHLAVDLWLAITSARNNIFSWDQKHLKDIGILYQKRFLKISWRPPCPISSRACMWHVPVHELILSSFFEWSESIIEE